MQLRHRLRELIITPSQQLNTRDAAIVIGNPRGLTSLSVSSNENKKHNYTRGSFQEHGPFSHSLSGFGLFCWMLETIQ